MMTVSSLLLTVGSIAAIGGADAFSPRIWSSATPYLFALQAANGGNCGPPFSRDLIEQASNPLLWETLRAAQAKPFLDLSRRDQSPEDIVAAAEENNGDDQSWQNGQVWQKTQGELQELGAEISDDSFLNECPQLLRLDTEAVMESAKWIVEEFDTTRLIQEEPKLLAYPRDDVEYGLEFMSTMMMINSKAACAASPKLLLAGIEGGIQERVVQKALGAASTATSQANQKIAADAMTALKSLQNRKQ